MSQLLVLEFTTENDTKCKKTLIILAPDLNKNFEFSGV